jgi:hypothetical protein
MLHCCPALGRLLPRCHPLQAGLLVPLGWLLCAPPACSAQGRDLVAPGWRPAFRCVLIKYFFSFFIYYFFSNWLIAKTSVLLNIAVYAALLPSARAAATTVPSAAGWPVGSTRLAASRAAGLQCTRPWSGGTWAAAGLPLCANKEFSFFFL